MTRTNAVTQDAAENSTAKLVVFGLDEQRYALPLSVVERIVRAVAVTPLPQAPAIVLGIVNVAGRIIPVFNIRRRFNLPERRIEPADQLALVRTAQRTAALVIDRAEGVVERPTAAIVSAMNILPGLEHLHGVIKLEDGLVLIHDPEKFLSPDEARDLDSALQREAPHAQ